MKIKKSILHGLLGFGDTHSNVFQFLLLDFNLSRFFTKEHLYVDLISSFHFLHKYPMLYCIQLPLKNYNKFSIASNIQYLLNE